MRDTSDRTDPLRRVRSGPGPTTAIRVGSLAALVSALVGSLTAPGVAAQEAVECPDRSDAVSGLAGRVLEGGGALGIPGATVFATWNDEAGRRQSATATAGDGGVYVLCGLPTGRRLTIEAAFASYASEPLTAVIEPGPPAGWDFEIEARPGSTAGNSRVPGRIVGRVTDRRSGRPVEAATVTIEPASGAELSDGSGRFSIEGLVPGVYRVGIRHLAYEPLEQLVNVPGDQTVEIRFELSADPIELEPLVVTVLRERRLETQGFYERKEIAEKVGNGIFLTREDIRRANPVRVSHLLGQLPGIQLECSGMGYACRIKMTGGNPSLGSRAESGCINSNVYVDGVRVLRDNQASPEPLDNFVIPSEVAAIEVYRGPSEIPAEFGGSTGRCGAIVIWTGNGR